MNYPAKEHEKHVIEKNQEEMAAMAKFYVESETMPEFKVKAAAAGIYSRYKMLLFYVYYTAHNSTNSCADALTMMSFAATAIIVAVLLLVSISLLSLLGRSFWWLLCYLPFPIAILMTIDHVFRSCFSYVDNYITLSK